jgi:hypothetical protein
MVTRLHRGCLLPVYPMELVGHVRQAGGDGRADQPRFWVCLPIRAGEQGYCPFPDRLIAGAAGRLVPER